MGTHRQEEARRRGQARLASMRRRAQMLRKRIVVSGLVTFALLWAVVFGQMLSGNDPVLSGSSGAGPNSAAGGNSGPQVSLVRGNEPGGEAPPLGAEQRSEEERAAAEQAESELAEAEQTEQAELAEQAELEQLEAEEQELEAVTTGQS